MSTAKAIIKAVTMGLTVVSFIAVAETYYDKKFYTANFMDKVEEVRIDITPAVEKRVVASKEKDLPLIHKVEMKNKSLVDGSWMITRVSQFFDDNERVVFDKYNKSEDRDAEVIVDFKMLETSVVRINEDVQQTYRISLLTENGTIALFKEFGEGYEVVEARRIKEEVKLESEEESLVQIEKKNKFDIRDDLFLVSAVDPKRDKNLLKGEKVEGYAYLKNGELILEGIQLHVGTQNQTDSLSTEMRIKNHGTFNDQNGSQGIVTITSKEEIKVRFSTGPLAGALLNFASYDKKEEIERKYNQSQKQVEAAINDDAEERREERQIDGLEEIPQELIEANSKGTLMEEEAPQEVTMYPEDNSEFQEDLGDQEQQEYSDEYSEEIQEDSYDKMVQQDEQEEILADNQDDPQGGYKF